MVIIIEREFKSWARLIAFNIALISFGKIWVPLFSLHFLVNRRADWVLQLWLGNQSRRRKTVFKHVKLHFKNWPCVTSCEASAEGLVKTIQPTNSIRIMKHVNVISQTSFFLSIYLSIYLCIYKYTYIYIYIYIYRFYSVKFGVIPSGQENHSKPNI